MKFRAGFISNSSSASFIINWECHMERDGKPLSLRSAVCAVFDMEDERESEDHTKYVFDYVDFVFENSVEHRPGVFTTNFYTSMLNWPCDFGDDAAQFFFALHQQLLENGRANFEITSTKLEKD